MLNLELNTNEKIVFDDYDSNKKIVISPYWGGFSIKLAIDAPKAINIYREKKSKDGEGNERF